MKHKQIAPRLSIGKPRVSFGGRLPNQIKEGLRAIARDENKSMSWVMEETIIRFFKLKAPSYKETGGRNER